MTDTEIEQVIRDAQFKEECYYQDKLDEIWNRMENLIAGNLDSLIVNDLIEIRKHIYSDPVYVPLTEKAKNNER